MKKSKFIIGLATAAIATGITTASNASALDTDVSISELPDSVYTVVGPTYFTVSDMDIDALYEDNVTVTVADPTVADFISADGSPFRASSSVEPMNIMDCYYKYQCLQGKKNGTTDIIIKEDDVETKRIRVTSVTLNVNPINYVSSGETFNLTGSITGADNNLLGIKAVATPSSKVQINQTGPRSISITSIKNIDQGKVAYTIWKVGDQEVGGGTNFNIMIIDAYDNVDPNGSNKQLLTDTVKALFDTLHNNGWSYGQKLMNGEDLPGLIVMNGVKMNVYHPGDNYMAFLPGPAGSKHTIYLNKNENAEYTDEQDSDLKGKLPEGSKAISSISGVYANIFSVTPDQTTLIATVYDFGENVINVPVAAPKNLKPLMEGYKRTWYVSFKSMDGTYEILEAKYNAETGVIDFDTTKAGDYVIGYVDEPINETPKVPNTGVALMQKTATAIATISPLVIVTFISISVAAKKREGNKLAKKHNHFE